MTDRLIAARAALILEYGEDASYLWDHWLDEPLSNLRLLRKSGWWAPTRSPLVLCAQQVVRAQLRLRHA